MGGCVNDSLCSLRSSIGKDVLSQSLSFTLNLSDIFISLRCSYRDSWSNFFSFLFFNFSERLLDSDLRLNKLLLFSLWKTNVDNLKIIDLCVRRTVRIREHFIYFVFHLFSGLLTIFPENIWIELCKNLSNSVIDSRKISCEICLLIILIQFTNIILQ